MANPEGKTLVLKTALPGDVLGLNSVLAGAPHDVAVETVEQIIEAFTRVGQVGSEQGTAGETKSSSCRQCLGTRSFKQSQNGRPNCPCSKANPSAVRGVQIELAKW